MNFDYNEIVHKGELDVRSLVDYDLEGYWLADFGTNGYELVELKSQTNQLVATKITGDPHVPSGEFCFKIDLLTAQGHIQIAERGFKNPQWKLGCIGEIKGRDSFVFKWFPSVESPPIKRTFTRLYVQPSFSNSYQFEGDIISYSP